MYKQLSISRGTSIVAIFAIVGVLTIAVTWHSDSSRMHRAITPTLATTSIANTLSAPSSATVVPQTTPTTGIATGTPGVFAPPTLSTAPSATVVAIPEANIKLTLPDSLRDLEYSVNTTTLLDGNKVTQIYLSTTTLRTGDSGCSPSAGGIGALTKAYGQYPSSNPYAGNLYGVLVQQFPTFFISYSRPQAACTTNASVVAHIGTNISDLLTAIKGATQAN